MGTDWHSFPFERVFREVQSGDKGLSAAESGRRLKEHGKNEIPKIKPIAAVWIFLRQFHNPLMYIVLVAVVLSSSLKHYSDAIFILVVILINTSIGFYQELKAGRTFEALKRLVRIKARVLRDADLKEIDGEELVVGDVIVLRAGDKVPADGRIIDCRNLRINESVLTGESFGVRKDSDPVEPRAVLGDRSSMVFMGTVVEEGYGRAVIVETGSKTELGQIVLLMREAKEQLTPLQEKISHLSRLIGGLVLTLIGAIVLIGYATEKSFIDIFVAALALAVSAIPSGLLPAITVILVLGMRRIFNKNGLVRRLAATETLGSVTVICTDKTGTLTEGKMLVSHILTGNRELLGGSFNGIAGGDKKNGVESHITALKIGMLANEGFIEDREAELKEWIVRGTPTEQALLLAGAEAGLDKKELEGWYPLVDRIGFDSDLKYAAALHSVDQYSMLHVVGAPERIIAQTASLDIDGRISDLDSAESRALLQKLEELTRKGLRVVACGYARYPQNITYQSLHDLVKDLVLVGFIALKDPLRPEAASAIASAHRAGIKTIMITGDHRLTAKTIAEEVGFKTTDDAILDGNDLDGLSDEELRERSKSVKVYARVSPRHKLRIVAALAANGEIVAMIGDGVNDAPALKAAHIGVAVGSGTDVAKETADLVLLDNSFETVVKSIEQGRLIFQNIRKVFVYLVADDFSELFLFLGAMSFGFPLPLLPAQILWINFVEDGFPDIALTTEQETKGLMEEKPRDPSEPILNRPLRKWMIAIFFITGIAAFLTFTVLWKASGDLEKTRTMVFALMALDSLIFAYCVRSFKRPIFRRDILSNRYLVGASGAGLVLLLGAVYLPFLQQILGTVPLSLKEWGVVAGISLLELLLLELTKYRIFIAPAKRQYGKI